MNIVLADDWRTSVDMIHFISTLQFTQVGGSNPASESFRRSTMRAEPLPATIARRRQAFVPLGTERLARPARAPGYSVLRKAQGTGEFSGRWRSCGA